MKKKPKKFVSLRDRRRAARKAAMPAVNALVKKHGLAIVNACIGELKQLARERAHVAKVQAELRNLELRLARGNNIVLRKRKVRP